ncbi:hypothetical protein [Poriferisphaera sp. WC338]|uniref:hypothetical protein n=1 Tax=Poriferisphaera sp. WC338 TaxID=3425129 RepID=UPI003D81B1BE
MKPKYIIPIICLLVIAIATLYNQFGFPPDPPTNATAPDTLKPITLSTNLPHIFPAPSDSHMKLAVHRYGQIIENANQAPDDPEAIAERADELVDLMTSTRFFKGFSDYAIPITIDSQPSFGNALENITTKTIEYANTEPRLTPNQRLQVLQSLFALGHQLFIYNQRLYIRNTGLGIMNATGNTMYKLVLDHPELKTSSAPLDKNILIWSSALTDINKQWHAKLAIVMDLDPHRGDLMNIAQNDQDPTFRTEAILRLGLFQHAPKSKGNLRLMQHIIKRAKSDPDPNIQAAANAAANFTREQAAKFK